MENNTQVVTNTDQAPVKRHEQGHGDEVKTTFLFAITIVLGILSIISLVFLLKVKKSGVINVPRTSDAPIVAEKPVDDAASIIEDDELGRKKMLYELDRVDFDSMAESYSDSAFDQWTSGY